MPDIVTESQLLATFCGGQPEQIALRNFIHTVFAGIGGTGIQFKGTLDCSANPTYPAAALGDIYIVSVAGKIGGASGLTVAVGDMIIANAVNAGGAQGTVGGSWNIIEHQLVGPLLAANNLSDLVSSATARTNLGLGTAALLASSTDGTLAANSDGNIPTQKAVKTYVDSNTSSSPPQVIGWPLQDLKTGGVFSSGFCGLRLIVVPKTGTITGIRIAGVTAAGTATLKPAVYAVNNPGAPGALLAQGATVTGFIAGVNSLPLTAPLAVTRGQLIFVGAQIGVVSVAPATMASGIETAYFASVGALVDPAPASLGVLNIASFYAEMG